MKHMITGLVLSFGLLTGVASLAQDNNMAPAPDNSAAAPASPPKSSGKHQMMKECMSRQMAKNDGSTKKQMRAACKAEMKAAAPDANAPAK